MGGLLTHRLPIGTTEAQMIESALNSVIFEYQRILKDLLNTKPNTKKYKELKKEAWKLLNQKNPNSFSVLYPIREEEFENNVSWIDTLNKKEWSLEMKQKDK